MTTATPSATLSAVAPVVLARVPPTGGTGRDRLTAAERDGGLLLSPEGYLGRDAFDRYRRVAGELRFVAAPAKGQVGDGPAVARACASLQAAGFVIRVADDAAAARLRAGAGVVGAVVADADAQLERVCAALASRGLVPRPYQLDGIRWIRATQAGALLDDMGLGKTMQILLGFGDRILIFCPASVKGVWAREAAMWRPDLVPVILSGRGSFRWPEQGEIVIVNYDVVAAADVTAAGPCPAGVDAAADEGHVVKNGRTSRAKAIKAAFAAVAVAGGRRLLVTATPICNRPLELRAVLEAVGAFKAAFSSWAAFSRAFGGAVRSAEALPTEEAAVALSRVSLRRTKGQVAKDLPSLTIAERRVELEGKAVEIATAIELRLRAQLETAVAAAGPDPAAIATAIEAALRAGSEIGEMAAARRVLALAKLPAALELVEECEDAGRPIVLASAHREVCERVAEREGWALIAGGVDADERTRIVERFQRGELRGVALTIKAGGVGLTLTAAADMVVVDLEWNPALNDQLFARIHRIGQDRPCTVTLLRGDAWIEDRMAELLDHKARMISATVDRVAELGGRIAAAPDLSAIVVGRPAPVLADEQVAAVNPRPVARRPGWIVDPALVDRLHAVAPLLPSGHVGGWLTRIAGETGGELPPAVRGRDTRELVAAAEAEVERVLAARAEDAARRPAQDDREAAAAAAAAAILQLAGQDSDRAREKNGVGFAASTTSAGHRLAALLSRGELLTPAEWEEAQEIAAYHHRQVGVLTELSAEEVE